MQFDIAMFEASMRNALYERSQETRPAEADSGEIAPAESQEDPEEEPQEEDPELQNAD